MPQGTQVTQGQFQDLTKRVDDSATKADLKKLEDRVSLFTWLPTLVIVITLIGLGVTVWVRFDGKFDSINSRFDSVNSSITDVKTSIGKQNERIDKVQSAIDVLSNKQSEQTQSLIKQLLATAQTEPNLSAKAIAITASLTKTLQSEKQTASPEFFSSAVSSLNRLSRSASKEVANAKLVLAEYRSSIFRPANLATIVAPGSTRGLTIEDIERLPRDRDISVNGFRVYRTMATPFPDPRGLHVAGDGATIILNMGTGDWLSPAEGGVRGDNRSIVGVVAVTPSQTLDGFYWENVVFVNARIRYLGGSVTLKNVRFVDCTFDVPNSVRSTPRANNLFDYALLNQDDRPVGL